MYIKTTFRTLNIHFAGERFSFSKKFRPIATQRRWSLKISLFFTPFLCTHTKPTGCIWLKTHTFIHTHTQSGKHIFTSCALDGQARRWFLFEPSSSIFGLDIHASRRISVENLTNLHTYAFNIGIAQQTTLFGFM